LRRVIFKQGFSALSTLSEVLNISLKRVELKQEKMIALSPCQMYLWCAQNIAWKENKENSRLVNESSG